MPGCALRYCNARYGKTSGLEFGLFSFPPVSNLAREKWIQFVQKDRREENWLPSAASKLCTKHFRKEDIYFGKTGRAILKKGSVPYTNEDSIDSTEATEPTTPVDVDISDSESIFDSPREIALKAQVQKLHKQKIQYRTKIKKICTQNRYLKHKLINLKDFVDQLEKKFDFLKNEANSLKATADLQALFDRRNRNSTKPSLTRR